MLGVITISFLNGWRRLGIVLFVFWLITIVGVTTFEFTTSDSFIFTYKTMPKGTVIKGNVVTFPSGKSIVIDIPVDLFTGEIAKPWEIEWDKYPYILKESHINWSRLVVIMLVVPLIFWLVIEVSVYAFKWVRQGFKHT